MYTFTHCIAMAIKPKFERNAITTYFILGGCGNSLFFSHYQFLFCLGSAFNGCFTGVLKCFVPQMIDPCSDDNRSETYKVIAQIILEVGAIALSFALYYSLQVTSLVNIPIP